MTDSVGALFRTPKAANVPDTASQANIRAQEAADQRSNDLARREAAAMRARTRGRGLLLFDTPLGVQPGLSPDRG